MNYNIGDRVFVTADNYGSDAVIVDTRDAEGSYYKVRTSHDEFWAYDFEISDALTDAERATNRETTKHIEQVRALLQRIIDDLQTRAIRHDQSKLERPEVAIFTEYTPKLAGSTYGSDEYKQFLAEMKPALDHHYAHNSHHPEHYSNGVDGMSLLDVVEMLCDWKAATMRHKDGDIQQSLEINTKRFNMSPQLVSILRNTLPLIEGRKEPG